MSHNRILISFFLLNTIAFLQEDVPFDISKQFAVPIDNNQLIWNDDSYFDILLIDRSSKNFKNKFLDLQFDEIVKDTSYVKSKFIYEFGDYGFDKLRVGVKKKFLK